MDEFSRPFFHPLKMLEESMARRPNPNANLTEPPQTLQKAFDACQNEAFDPETGAGQPAEASVGQRLKELRKKHNWSIRALAAQSGLAVNTLSMIENGKTSPSVSTLQILAQALDMPITAFFAPEMVEKKVVYVEGQDRPSILVDTTRLEHLGKNLAGNAVQPFVITLQPGANSGKTMIVHTGHEFVYCLCGQVMYTIEEKTYPLKPGDSIVFESHLPHTWENSGSEPAQLILVLIPSDSRDTPAERHFPLE
jgi:transcriptional regulator with XRE-family HTH domain